MRGKTKNKKRRKKLIKPSMCAYTFERTRPCAGGELAIAACARDEGVVYEHWYEYTRRARARACVCTRIYTDKHYSKHRRKRKE